MDSTAKSIVDLCRMMARRTNRAASTISRLATGSGDTIDRLERGGRITTARAERSLQNLSAMWPADLDWPANVARPIPQAEKETAS